MTDYTKLLSDFPEINPANYGDDEVNALNAWGIAAHTAIEALQAKLGDAIEQLELFAILVRNAALEEAAKVCFAMPAPTHCNRAEANLCDVMTAQCENEIRNLKEPTP